MSQNQSKIPSSPAESPGGNPTGRACQTQSKTFGKYILEKKLGQGGMGAGYEQAIQTAQQHNIRM